MKKRIDMEMIIAMQARDAFLDNVDPRRRQEAYDSRLIEPDYKAPSNLSPRFMNKTFAANKFAPKTRYNNG